jgi:hypothetical protein
MTERIHDALDGELPAECLTPREAAELDEMEEAVRDALSRVRAEPVPTMSATIMARVNQLPRHAAAPPSAFERAARTLRALWQPRTLELTFRPAWVVAGAAVLAFLTVRPVRIDGPPVASAPPVAASLGSDPLLSPAAAPVVLVQFRLHAPDAQQVHLAGDFTDWRADHALHQAVDGMWTITLPVPAGVHEYGFVVDGERWVADPLAPPVDDGFGGRNSRLDVLAVQGLGL